MTTFHLDLPDDLAAKLRARAAEAGHASVDDFIRDVLRDQVDLLELGCPTGILDEEDPELEAELIRRIKDPRPGVEVTPQFWADLKRELHERSASKPKP